METEVGATVFGDADVVDFVFHAFVDIVFVAVVVVIVVDVVVLQLEVQN